MFCKKGGRTKERGRDTRKPVSQPFAQAAIKRSLIPTFIIVIARDINMDMTTAISEPKKRICRKVIYYSVKRKPVFGTYRVPSLFIN
jgi:hypothetical protein